MRLGERLFEAQPRRRATRAELCSRNGPHSQIAVQAPAQVRTVGDGSDKGWLNDVLFHCILQFKLCNTGQLISP